MLILLFFSFAFSVSDRKKRIPKRHRRYFRVPYQIYRKGAHIPKSDPVLTEANMISPAYGRFKVSPWTYPHQGLFVPNE